MKKVFGLLFIMLLSPLSVLGADRGMGMNINVTDPIANDYYGAGRNINIEGNSAGDLTLFGQTINILNNVQQDVNIFAQTITIKANINDDLKIVGQDINILGNIQGDAIIAGNSLIVGKNAIINGDLIVDAKDVTIEGKVLGNVYIKSKIIALNGTFNNTTYLDFKKITIGNQASIAGNLSYSTKQSQPELEKITVGSKTFSLDEHQQLRQKFGSNSMMVKKIILGIFAYKFLFLLIFGSILFFSMRGALSKAGDLIIKKSGRTFLTGFLLFIGLPILAILLTITIIGIPLGLVMIVMFILFLMLYELLSVAIFTSVFTTLWFKNSPRKKFFEVVLLIVLSGMFALISGLDIIPGMFAYGALMMLRFKHLQELNK